MLAALAEFAAGAGHEMNNPLAVIAGRAQLLLRDETHPERRRDLALIHTQALRVHEMIADLMLFARPPAPERRPCDLAALVVHVTGELSPRAAAQQTQLRVTVLGGPCLVTADATQLAVALRSLVVNALEALHRDGMIEVELTVSADTAHITVRDDGPGLTPEARRHAFDPFYSGRSAGRGLGLGLCKCWRIVTLHDGQLTTSDDISPGAEFVITLPLTTNND